MQPWTTLNFKHDMTNSLSVKLLWYYILPVVPQKAAAEVSKIGNL
jgi:hypothetical protein